MNVVMHWMKTSNPPENNIQLAIEHGITATIQDLRKDINNNANDISEFQEYMLRISFELIQKKAKEIMEIDAKDIKEKDFNTVQQVFQQENIKTFIKQDCYKEFLEIKNNIKCNFFFKFIGGIVGVLLALIYVKFDNTDQDNLKNKQKKSNTDDFEML